MKIFHFRTNEIVLFITRFNFVKYIMPKNAQLETLFDENNEDIRMQSISSENCFWNNKFVRKWTKINLMKILRKRLCTVNNTWKMMCIEKWNGWEMLYSSISKKFCTPLNYLTLVITVLAQSFSLCEMKLSSSQSVVLFVGNHRANDGEWANKSFQSKITFLKYTRIRFLLLFYQLAGIQ